MTYTLQNADIRPDDGSLPSMGSDTPQGFGSRQTGPYEAGTCNRKKKEFIKWIRKEKVQIDLYKKGQYLHTI